LNILITNVYTHSNKGDAAIVCALIYEIDRAFGKSGNSTLIHTADPTNDIGKYNVEVRANLLYIILTKAKEKGSFFGTLHIIFNLFFLTLFLIAHKFTKINLSRLASRDLKDYLSGCLNADISIACGGGYLRSRSSSPTDTLILLVTCLEFLVPKMLNKKTYLYSQSIGPIHGRTQKLILKYSLKKVDLILSREEISTVFIRDLDVGTECIQVADPVFSLFGSDLVRGKGNDVKNSTMRVGITVRDWFDDVELYRKYLKSVAKTIDFLSENYSATIYYVPQVIASNFGDDDRRSAELLRQYIKSKDSLVIIDEDLEVSQIIEVCGSMDYFIGTRMHSNIFALISGVPTIAIEYEPKTRGIMRSLDLEKWVVPINDLTDGKDLLNEYLEKLIVSETQYRSNLKSVLPKIKKKSQSAIDEIKKSINA